MKAMNDNKVQMLLDAVLEVLLAACGLALFSILILSVVHGCRDDTVCSAGQDQGTYEYMAIEVRSVAYTRDKTLVEADAIVTYSINRKNAGFCRGSGHIYSDHIIVPLAMKSLRDAIRMSDASDLLESRDAVTSDVMSMLSESLQDAGYDVVVTSADIVHARPVDVRNNGAVPENSVIGRAFVESERGPE